MNRRSFLYGLCGAVAAVLGWPKKTEALPRWLPDVPFEAEFPSKIIALWPTDEYLYFVCECSMWRTRGYGHPFERIHEAEVPMS